MITLTPTAAQAIREIMKKETFSEGTALRLGLTTDGCEGSGTQFRYLMDFEPEPQGPYDTVFITEGISIYVHEGTLPHLDGLLLDVTEHLGGFHFIFRNPQARHSCGCGHTFSD